MKWPVETLRLFPTLRCDGGCWYCVMNEHGAVAEFAEQPARLWVDFIGAVEGVKRFVVSGGEPTLYPGLADVVRAGLARDWDVGVYSNGGEGVVKLAEEVEPHRKFYIDCSYHLHSSFADAYAARWLAVRKRGHRVSVAAIVYPQNITDRYAAALRFYKATRERMVFKPLDGAIDDSWYSDHCDAADIRGPTRKAKCFMGDAHLAPDGDVYRCHRFMYVKDRRGVVGHVGGRVEIPEALTEADCEAVGDCSTCDAGSRRLDGVWENRLP